MSAPDGSRGGWWLGYSTKYAPSTAAIAPDAPRADLSTDLPVRRLGGPSLPLPRVLDLGVCGPAAALPDVLGQAAVRP